jgi:hypothetical protein
MHARTSRLVYKARKERYVGEIDMIANVIKRDPPALFKISA